MAKAEGVPNARFVEYPPPNISAQSPEEVREYAEALFDKVIEALTKEVASTEGTQTVVEPDPRDIVFKGTFDEVNKYFYENQWTDGPFGGPRGPVARVLAVPRESHAEAA